MNVTSAHLFIRRSQKESGFNFNKNRKSNGSKVAFTCYVTSEVGKVPDTRKFMFFGEIQGGMQGRWWGGGLAKEASEFSTPFRKFDNYEPQPIIVLNYCTQLGQEVL